MIEKVLFTSRSEEWSTPQEFFDKLDSEFHFNLDPCATDQNAKCKHYFTINENGLSKDWSGQRVFMNPPYGKTISLWMKKARTGCAEVCVCLVHSRTDTRWWHENVEGMAEVRFVKGRIKFGGAKYNAPFPSAIVIYRKK